MDDDKVSTLAVSKETQRLIREYCFIHQINMKKFVDRMAKEKLTDFKKAIEELRKLNL
jgi:hypothetical protein